MPLTVVTSEKKTSNQELISIAQKRFKLCEDSFSEIRKLALDDLNFRVGNQWPDEIISDRQRESRPCLTINTIPSFIRQIVNEQRRNRQVTRVSPVDSKGDPEIARVLQGMIRNIEYSSNASVAYDTAAESAVTIGFGFWRILTKYCSENSFNQEIVIEETADSMSVYCDPSAIKKDRSDAEFWFIFTSIKKDEFNKTYPDKNVTDAQMDENGWVTEDSVRICEYWYKDYEDAEIILLDSGEVIESSLLDEAIKNGKQEKNRRKIKKPKIKWSKLTSFEELESGEWAGTLFPFVMVLGDEFFVDGERYIEGIVRQAKDSQRMLNYWESAKTEMVALAPKTPFIAAEGQIEGREEQWRTSNVKNHSVLEYKPVSHNGVQLPPPQRNVYEPPIGALTQARMQSSDDMKMIIGLYNSSLGAEGVEKSGRAILARQNQGQVANFHFTDNLSRAMKYSGQVLIDLIPRIYDAPRMERIIGEDGKEEMIAINQIIDGVKSYESFVGTYDVTIDSGPSYTSKRQEGVEAMMELSRSFPELPKIAGDLMVSEMDWAGAKEIAERIKKTMPPELVGGKDGKNPQAQLPPEVQQHLAQADQAVQQLQAQLAQLTQEKEQKQIEMSMKAAEIQSKEKIEFEKLRVRAAIEMAKMDNVRDELMIKKEIDHLDSIQKVGAFQLRELQEKIMNGQHEFSEPQQEENAEHMMEQEQVMQAPEGNQEIEQQENPELINSGELPLEQENMEFQNE